MTAKQRTLSLGSIKYQLTWRKYISLIQILIKKIKKSGIKFDYIYGIPRGGLIPSVIISHALNIKLATDRNIYDCLFGKDDLVLLVDDIIDTGRTIEDLEEYTEHYFKTKIAAIFKHKNSPIVPDFFVEENDMWVEFPYEKE